MVNRTLVLKQWRDIWHRKGGIAALVLIVTVGIGCFLGFAGVWRDMDASRRAYYSEYRLADFIVTCKCAPNRNVQQLSSLPNIRSVQGRVSQEIRIHLSEHHKPITGRAISVPSVPETSLNGLCLRTGSWFSTQGSHEVILNHAFAGAHQLSPGSRIKVVILKKQYNLLVVGTAISPEYVYLIPPGSGIAPDPANLGIAYLPERFLQDCCNLRDAFNQVIGKLNDKSPGGMRVTLERISGRLDPYGVETAHSMEKEPSVRFLADELKGLKISSRVMPLIFLFVAVLVLNVLMGRMVTQQREIIGTLKAIGYGKWAITCHYLSYGIIIGLLGGTGGIAFGIWVERTLASVYREFFTLPSIDPHFWPDLILYSCVISVGAAVFGTLRGARAATRLQPAEAMRPPPPERGGRVPLEYISFFWSPLPFWLKMAFRSIFRNPFRSTVSVLASTAATALIVTTLSTVDSLDYLMEYEFKKVTGEDVKVQFRSPREEGARREIACLPSVSKAEPELSVVCSLSNGIYRKRIAVTGLTKENELYTPLDENQNPIQIPLKGLVLSKKLASILHVSTGDRLRMRALTGTRQAGTTYVAGIAQTYLGLSAYTDIRYLSRFTGESWVSGTVRTKFFSRVPPSGFFQEISRRPEVVAASERKHAFKRIQETFGKTMGAMISLLVLFAGAIAFGSVLNAALVSLSERRREVGTLRILGYTSAQVWSIFLTESCILNGLGIAAGFLAGTALAQIVSQAYSTELYRFPVLVCTSHLLTSALLMILFVGTAQLVIFRVIRKINWLEAVSIKE